MEEENQFYQLYPAVFLGSTHGKLDKSYFQEGDQVDKPPNQFVLAHSMAHKIVGRVYVTVSKPTKFTNNVVATDTQSPTTNSLLTLPCS